MPKQRGPYKVLEALPSGVTYIIKRIGSQNKKDCFKVHIDDIRLLKRFNSSTGLAHLPKQPAKENAKTYEVEYIMGERSAQGGQPHPPAGRHVQQPTAPRCVRTAGCAPAASHLPPPPHTGVSSHDIERDCYAHRGFFYAPCGPVVLPPPAGRPSARWGLGPAQNSSTHLPRQAVHATPPDSSEWP